MRARFRILNKFSSFCYELFASTIKSVAIKEETLHYNDFRIAIEKEEKC